MEYPDDFIIKEEPNFENVENDDMLELEYDVKVKVEDCAVLAEDRCSKNPVPFDMSLEEKRLECQLCHRYFIDCNSLYKHNIEHLKIVVRKWTAFECNKCFVYFTEKENHEAHVQAHTDNGQKMTKKSSTPVTKLKHQCVVCGKVLPYKSWHEHMRQVHAEKRVNCTKCGKDFKHLRNLVRHNKYVHDGVKAAWRSNAYKTEERTICELCDKAFNNRNSLRSHMRNCHCERRYQCYICKSSLKSKSYLLTHIRRVHCTDGNDHPCDVCGKKYKSNRYLKIHKKNVHYDKVINIRVKFEEL